MTETSGASRPTEIQDLLAGRLGVSVGLDASSDPPTLDVPAGEWHAALTTLRDAAGLDYFDWLSAVDLGADGFQVVAHVADLGRPPLRHVLVRTVVAAESPSLSTITDVFRGASWHERETYEMFGIDFVGHPNLVPLLLPDGFDGHPLRKDFVLVARAAKPWPGAKEPGESDRDVAPGRRRLLPPGVPDASWGARESADAPDASTTSGAAPSRVRRTRRPDSPAATAGEQEPDSEAPATDGPAPSPRLRRADSAADTAGEQTPDSEAPAADVRRRRHEERP